jgi:regulatory protein YycI of two-component signal transduction system YycFG
MIKTIFKVGALMLLLLLLVAFFTNPTKEQFAAKIQSELEKEVNEQTNNPALKYIAEIGLEFTKQIAEKMVERKNYGICSVFTVSLPDGDYAYLGAFGNYYPLQDENPLDQIRNLKQ